MTIAIPRPIVPKTHVRMTNGTISAEGMNDSILYFLRSVRVNDNGTETIASFGLFTIELANSAANSAGSNKLNEFLILSGSKVKDISAQNDADGQYGKVNENRHSDTNCRNNGPPRRFLLLRRRHSGRPLNREHACC